MGVPYITCLVCGKLTPVDRGRCYHCHSPLPSEVKLPRGYVICMNCLRVTPADSGFCRHCRAPFPPEVAEYSARALRRPLSTNLEGAQADREGEGFPLNSVEVIHSYFGLTGTQGNGESEVKGSGRGPDVTRVE